jgi:hypothetical protein
MRSQQVTIVFWYRTPKLPHPLDRQMLEHGGILSRVAMHLRRRSLQAAALSFSNAELLVEVAYPRCRLLKNMLRHFKRRDGFAGQETMIRNNFVQRLPHNSDRRCIKFPFQIIRRSQPNPMGTS